MPIKFEFYVSPDPSGEGKDKYHARTVSSQTVSTDQISSEIQMASSLTNADVRAVLASLSNRIAYHLSQSNRIHLEGIGYFQTTLKTSAEVDPKKTRAQSVWFKSVKFRADQELKKQLINVRTERSMIKVHSAKLTDEQVNRKVTAYLETHNFVTRKNIQMLLQMTRTTTLRHIRRMLEEGVIVNMGTRNQPIYVKP